LYVLGKNSDTNSLVVGERTELGVQELVAREVNWLIDDLREESFHAEVKIRYTAKEAAAQVTPIDSGSGVHIKFDSAQRDITAGQAAVFYQGDILIGGGIIQ
jgi:tRNA-specific 2-thiouridylase